MTRVSSIALWITRFIFLLSLTAVCLSFAYFLIRYGFTWDWKTDSAYLYGNRVAIESGLVLVVSAAIRTMPLPGSELSLKTIYTWFYDCTHQFLNITNMRPSDPPKPAVPELQEKP